MAYCTIALLTDRFGSAMLLDLSDRDNNAPAIPDIDTALFERAITDADALIDGYLLGRYALPIATPPALLVDISQRIAIYYAHGQVATDKVRKDYEDALKTLEKIAAGIVRLNVDGAEPEASGIGGGVQMTEPDRPFTTGSMKGYI